MRPKQWKQGQKQEQASAQNSEGGMGVAERTGMTFLGLLLPP